MFIEVNHLENILKNNGFKLMEQEVSSLGTEIVSGYRDTDRGMVEVAIGTNGCARVIKPNGSVKWLYEKSAAQIARCLAQTIEANTYRKAW